MFCFTNATIKCFAFRTPNLHCCFSDSRSKLLGANVGPHLKFWSAHWKQPEYCCYYFDMRNFHMVACASSCAAEGAHGRWIEERAWNRLIFPWWQDEDWKQTWKMHIAVAKKKMSPIAMATMAAVASEGMLPCAAKSFTTGVTPPVATSGVSHNAAMASLSVTCSGKAHVCHCNGKHVNKYQHQTHLFPLHSTCLSLQQWAQQSDVARGRTHVSCCKVSAQTSWLLLFPTWSLRTLRSFLCT